MDAGDASDAAAFAIENTPILAIDRVAKPPSRVAGEAGLVA